MNRWWVWVAALDIAFTLWWLVRAGARVPLWYDELFTVRLSAIAGLGPLRRALGDSLDFNPPGLYLLTHAARTLPVTDPLASRLPAVAAFVVLACALFFFLRRRTGPAIAAAVVAVMPLSNFVERYAIEARAYMPVLAMAGCAMLCWQRARGSTGRRRTWAAVGLGASVFAALALHVWAILLPGAIVCVEALAWLRTRRVPWTILLALAAAAPALGWYPAIVEAARTVSVANEVYAPAPARLWSGVLTTVPRLLAIGLAGLLVALARLVSPSSHSHRAIGDRDRATNVPSGLTRDERRLFVLLLLSPLVPYVAAVATGGAFMPRYALFAVIGTAGLLADVLDRIAGPSQPARTAAALVASALLCVFLPARLSIPVDAEVPSLRVLRASAASRDPGVPVVLVDPLDALAVDARASAAERAALRFVADPPAARQYTGADLVDATYLRGEPYLGLGIPRTTFDALTRESARLYLLGEWTPLSWLPRRLKDNGWRMTRVGGMDAAPLYVAER